MNPMPDAVHVTIDGTDVATYTLEPAISSPIGDVVFCHGTPWSSRIWSAAARHLSATYRVFLWDMPGYGRSIGDAVAPVDLSSQMRRLPRLLDHWHLDNPHVVAHDVGASVALGAHLLHGSRYSSLFLWDPVILEPWGSPFFGLVAENSAVFTELPAPLHAALVKAYIAGAARNLLSDTWIDELSAPWMGTRGQSAFYRQIEALRPEHTRPIADNLQHTRCAVKIGWGEQDPWIPVTQAVELARLLPNQPSIVRLGEVGHLAPIEAPEIVNSAIEDWIGTATE